MPFWFLGSTPSRFWRWQRSMKSGGSQGRSCRGSGLPFLAAPDASREKGRARQDRYADGGAGDPRSRPVQGRDPWGEIRAPAPR
jgi:hypothetical protein